MMKKRYLPTVLLLLFLISCKTKNQDPTLIFKFIQVNDVYEIAPLSGGKYGGMSRVAHVRDSIKKENPNTFLFMAGDFLNPSLLGTLKVDGERIKGKQMVEVMNAMNFDLVTFGNHEFDIKESDLQKRLNESSFPWVSSNVLHVTDNGNVPFTIQKKKDTINIPNTYILDIKGEDEQDLKIGFISITIPSNPKDYVHYGAIYEDAEKAYNSIKDKVDVVMGLTHLEIEQDTELLKKIPEIPFIMGGHEHNAMLVPVGNSLVAKADANAKTLYIHTFTYHLKSKKLEIDSKLLPIDEKIAFQPQVKAVVNKWTSILDLKIKEVIDDPKEVIYTAATPLDGTDSASRGIQTNLGDIITEAMAWAYDNQVDAALVNGGSIRVDDMLPAQVTSMDIFRVLPFGGSIIKVKIKGDLLKEVLDYGKSKRGTGAYLQRYNVSEDAQGKWLVAGKSIKPNKIYNIAFSDFLLKGYDIPFLTPENKGVIEVYEPSENQPAADIRKAIIIFLKSKH
ncbi:MAG: bifunctional metallophosphatase/5'-nucleotidase [Flavobacteriales bacterium]